MVKLQLKKDGLGNDSESAYQTLIGKKTQVLSKFDSAKLEDSMRSSNKNTALELVQTLLPSGSKYGLLIDLETCFDIKIESNFEFNNSSQLGLVHDNKRQLIGTLSDNSQSIANAETEDEEFTPGITSKKVDNLTA